ncbi:TOMM precursor leader peptide-binding protein [Coleofasciculus chthonoplastes]|uniref:TOMM precursor leader peptide-binding protein n=1 Tax=Coleofasciculus chthonoplastes TaxID=64178 RepID=UPI0032F467D8
MTSRPRFPPYFRCEIVPAQGVFLLSEKNYILLRGESYIQLASLLDGQHTLTEICTILQAQFSPLDLLFLLDNLRREGYVVDANPSLPSEQQAFWGMLDITPDVAAKNLQHTTISVASWGKLDPTPFKTLLESMGVRVGDPGDLWVVLTDDYLHEGLEAFNQNAHRHGYSWMLVKPVGIELWIGPIFRPGLTGCWECLRHRLRGHRQVENYLQRQKNTTQPLSTSLSVLPSTQQIAFGIAATETAKWIVDDTNSHLDGTILTLNTLSWQKRHNRLIRRPQCSCCGHPQLLSVQQSAPIILQSQKKSFTSDGGHRSCAPEATFNKLADHISPITGITSAVTRNAVGDENIPIYSYVTDYNFVLMDDTLYFLRESLRSRCGGKGKSEIQAKTSALCESIERYVAVFQGDEARTPAQLAQLDHGIAPNACMLFSEQQFADRDQWNARGSRCTWVPEPFDPSQRIEWSPAWSLTHHRRCYVPTAYCYYGYTSPSGYLVARADGNGCAAGTTKEEAILQGFLELVERDSVALWWYNRLKKPGVDLSSFEQPYFQELVTCYQSLHRHLWVLDVSSDLPIPAFVAVSARYDQEVEDIILGFGAHLDPTLAISRALTELNQMLPAVFQGTPSSDSGYDPEAIAWWETATLNNQPYLLPDQTLNPKTPKDYPQYFSDDLAVDIRYCITLAQQQGLELIVVDQTRPDIDLQVVKVIVPGMRHFWPRFAPGRLYDVPVQMEWLTEPHDQEQLNPYPIFF